jgi:DNA-binding XRE family transcriptional regulator
MGELITIERSRYEALLRAEEALEDFADKQVVDEFLANPTEGVPDQFFSRILAGENPVLVYREWRGLTSAELARRAGLHRVQVHDIETGKRRGSVDTLKKLAAALNLPLDDIV